MRFHAQKLAIAAGLSKRVIRFYASASALLACLLLPFSARTSGVQQNSYDTGFDTIVKLTGNLHHTLDHRDRPQLYPAAVRLEKLAVPYLQIHESGAPTPIRAIYFSNGFVDLLNYVSHAKAIDGVSRGFLLQSMSRVALVPLGSGGVPDLQANIVRNAWAFETMNRQASFFNQMAGGLVAIQVAHVSLGHYQKYARLLTIGRHNPLPLNSVITPAEWRQAVLQGATRGLDCGLAVDGLKAFFESLDRMPVRPVWRIYFMPDGVDSKELSKINSELEQIQKKALVSFNR